jgi:hypothetical protein
MSEFKEPLDKLLSYIEKQEFKGYDPYDALNSWLPYQALGKYSQAFAIQFFKRNPVNLRPFTGVKKGLNPKGIGLLLNAYSKLYLKTQNDRYKEKADYLFNLLLTLRSPKYSNYCWGYNFDWANPKKVVPEYHPNIVATSFAAKGILEYYKISGNQNILNILISVCEFILSDLPVARTNAGICFSYTDIIQDCCFNASMLGAEILAATGSLTKIEKYNEHAFNALNFTLYYQKEDGHWNYEVDIKNGKEGVQIDFHQGYILDSIYNIVKEMKSLDNLGIKAINAIKKGTAFYRENQFYDDGRSLRRLPRVWPVDIHNQSQGIITFSLLKEFDDKYLDFANTIAKWTIRNMQDDSGYFYYQKHSLFLNKIPYMRWSQAWMLLAFSYLIEKQ